MSIQQSGLSEQEAAGVEPADHAKLTCGASKLGQEQGRRLPPVVVTGEHEQRVGALQVGERLRGADLDSAGA